MRLPLCCALSLWLLSACSSKPPAGPCTLDADCGGGSICNQGSCTQSCSIARPCPGGKVCLEGLCGDSPGCGAGPACDAGQCINAACYTNDCAGTVCPPGQVCEKDDIIRAVWPEDKFIERGIRDDSLAQLVRRLREKIEPDVASPKHVVTVAGRGYRFVK